MTFRELLAVGTQDQAEVDEFGLQKGESPVKECLAGGIWEVLLTPYDVAYPHRRVVHDRREVVGWATIRLEYYKVLDTYEADLTPQSVPEDPAPHRWPEV
jgi:hypothetical protein